jgi:hypothetical protein
MLKTILVILTIMVSACDDNPASTVTDVKTNVRFTTLIGGHLGSALFEESMFLIRTQEEAVAFASALNTEEALAVLTVVDYSKEMLMVIVRGPRGTINYFITINGIVSDGQQLKVQAVESGSNSGIRVIVYPIQVVEIQRTELPIQLEVEYICEGELVDQPCNELPQP